MKKVLALSLIELLILFALFKLGFEFWRAHSALAATLTLAVLALIGAALLRSRHQLHKEGYLVGPEGRDQIRYQELADGSVRSLTIDGEMLTGAPHVVYLPDSETWEKKMPPWAQPRRAEIVERVKKALGTKRYQFKEGHSRGA
jgi:hypothetical protein